MIENCLTEIQLEWKDRGLDLVRTSLGWRFQTKGILRLCSKITPRRGLPDIPVR